MSGEGGSNGVSLIKLPYLLAVCIGTGGLEQTGETQVRCHRMLHLITVYTVCHSSCNLATFTDSKMDLLKL